MFRKTNVSNPLISTRTCAYQGVRNDNFSDNFAYVPNVWPLSGKKFFAKGTLMQIWKSSYMFVFI